MGYFFATSSLRSNLVERPPEFRQVRSFLELFILEQIPYPSRFFNHNGHGIIDFMGDPGRQFTNGRQFTRFHDLLVHQRFLSIRLRHPVDHSSGEQKGHNNNADTTRYKNDIGDI